jgi:hypothetical protein
MRLLRTLFIAAGFLVIAVIVSGALLFREYLEWSYQVGSSPKPSELVCHDVAAEVISRIESGLTIPHGRLRGVQAVHSALDSAQWVVVADVQGPGYRASWNIGTWRITTRGDPSSSALAPDDQIAAVDETAAEVSSFPVVDDHRLNFTAENCALKALGVT